MCQGRDRIVEFDSCINSTTRATDVQMLHTKADQCCDTTDSVQMLIAHAQADVLVCAKGGGGLLKERMALVADLWGAGLRAELMQQAAPSLTAQYDYAHARHIPWLLIIQAATLSAADTVKVGYNMRVCVCVPCCRATQHARDWIMFLLQGLQHVVVLPAMLQ